MQPTFYSNDYVIVSKQSYHLFGDIQRGDVIVFRSSLLDEQGHQKSLIKRVIGLPGEVIEIHEGYVFINGQPVQEDYLAEQGVSGDMEPVTVEEGKVFVMGDNRNVSADSRDSYIGSFDRKNIVGIVRFKIVNKT